MNIYRLTLFHLNPDRLHATAHTASAGEVFSPLYYSQFKYGSGSAARHYAATLASVLNAAATTATGRLYITGSAYAKVPTAAVPLAWWTARLLAIMGRSTTYFHLSRSAFEGDYGASSLEARTQMLAKSPPYIGTASLCACLKGAHVVIIDDIRITGKHEQDLLPLLQKAGVATATFCYLAIVPQAEGEQDPLIEDRLNHAAIKTLYDITLLARQRLFYCNARTCKFILSAQPASIEQFVADMPLRLLDRFVRAMRSDSYDTCAQYREQFELFAQLVVRRHTRL